MTSDDAKALIQKRISELTQALLDEVLPIAREHKVEFSFLGMTYHLYPQGYSADKPGVEQIYSRTAETWRNIPRPPASEGLLVADEEWYSSTFGCGKRYWDWHMKNWPELEED